jgi:hypothetical protein
MSVVGKIFKLAAVVGVAAFLAACEDDGGGGGSPSGSHADMVGAPEGFSVETTTFKDDGSVGGWPITTVMRSVSVSGGQINMVYDDVDWPASGSPKVNGNCWFVLDRGGWTAMTFDFIRPNQEVKDVGEAARHFGIRGGERVGVFVSTLARDARRNGDERSNIYWITWP